MIRGAVTGSGDALISVDDLVGWINESLGNMEEVFSENRAHMTASQEDLIRATIKATTDRIKDQLKTTREWLLENSQHAKTEF